MASYYGHHNIVTMLLDVGAEIDKTNVVSHVI